MSANVEVKIKLNDGATAGLKKIAKEAEQAATKSSQAADRMSKNASAAVEQSVSKSRSQYEKLSQAREQLGIRSEKAVQNEIKQTEAAYNRLARSGTSSARELTRAQEATISKVRELRREMGELSKMQKLQKTAQNTATGAVTTATGLYAAKTVIDNPIRSYADLESAQADLKISLMTKGGKVSAAYDEILLQAVDLGNKLPGATKDFVAAATALKEQGMTESAIVGGGLKASASFGVLANMDQYQSATTIAKMREAYGLKDSELPEMANLMQKSKNAYGIAPDDFRAVAQYAAPTYNQLGLTGDKNAKQLLAVQGMAAGVGLENTSFGTNFAQMLQRTAVIDSRINKNSPEAEEVRKILSEFKIKMSFFDDKGKFSGIENMFAQLEKLKPLSEQDRIRVLNKMFGIEASRPAAIMVDKGIQGFRDSQSKLDAQADMDERIRMKTSTLKSKEESLNGTYENTKASAAAPLGEAKKGLLDSFNKLLSDTVQPWFKKDPSRGTDAILGTSIVAANAATYGATAALNAAGVSSAGAVGLAAAGTTLSATAGAGAVGYGLGKYAVNPLINLADEKLGTSIGDTIGRTVALYLAPFSENARAALMQDLKTQFSTFMEPTKVDNKLTVSLADGLMVKSQSSKISGPVTNLFETGSVWRQP